MLYQAKFEVEDGSGNRRKVEARVSANIRGIEVGFAGFGEFSVDEPDGMPIFVEFYEGVPVVYIWADINSEDPTHRIQLDGAAFSKRTP